MGTVDGSATGIDDDGITSTAVAATFGTLTVEPAVTAEAVVSAEAAEAAVTAEAAEAAEAATATVAVDNVDAVGTIGLSGVALVWVEQPARKASAVSVARVRMKPPPSCSSANPTMATDDKQPEPNLDPTHTTSPERLGQKSHYPTQTRCAAIGSFDYLLEPGAPSQTSDTHGLHPAGIRAAWTTW